MIRLSALLLALVLLLPLPCRAEGAETLQSGPWQYTLDASGGAVTVRYLGQDTEVTVPAWLDGHPVVTVGSGTFGSVHFPTVDRVIRKITLSPGIRAIAADSFFSCTQLEEVSLPEGLVSIGELAFQWCEKLERVNLPESLEEIVDCAFYGTALREVTLPAALVRLPANPFPFCRSLTAVRTAPGHPVFEVEDGMLFEKETRRLGCYPAGLDRKVCLVPEGTSAFGRRCFEGAPFSEIRIPDSVASVDGNPFMDCENLSAFQIPDTHPGLSALNGVLFSKDRSLLISYPVNRPNKTYSVPKTTRVIGEQAFTSVRRLERVNITGGVETISPTAFNGCKSVRQVRMAEGVKTIGYHAFSFCRQLSGLNLPESVETIGASAFDGNPPDFTVTVAAGSRAEEWCRGAGVPFTVQ